ncbi:hypothetical protein LZ31DRAFT_600779 [Colletotrichum somersetense]|nr:hypothetical protein LZ31DRAFT_600779 [Colletotrichum somersetense]
MAVSLQPSQNQSLPDSLVKREELAGVQIFDFTFEYDFSPLRKRASGSNVLLRIDYSDDPGYWSNFVAAAPTKVKRSAEQIEEEVHRDHGGNYKQYLYHMWSVDKRSTPQHKLHDLHARWFSKVNEQFRWNIYEESITCNIKGIDTTGYFTAWADLNVNIETSALLTLIGNMGDLSSLEESHVLFRNSGSVKTSLNLEAFVQLQSQTGRVELFGLQNFGATLSVPGIVTIGPNFRVLGQLTMIVTPQVTLGIVFNDDLVPDASFPIIEQQCASASSSVSETSPTAQSAKLVKRGDFIGSLICPADSSSSAQYGPCPLCGEAVDDATARLVKKRYGYIFTRDDETCELTSSDPDNPGCRVGDADDKRDLGLGLHSSSGLEPNKTRRSPPTLVDRSLTRKTGAVSFPDKTTRILEFGRYAPCTDATTSNSILRNLIYKTQNGKKCNADIALVTNNVIKKEHPVMKQETDHVYEAQTLTGFFTWLARGTDVKVGTYTMASAEWVKEVLFKDELPAGQSTGFDFSMERQQWMRVSNWFDFVFWEFDRLFDDEWTTWAGAPTNSAGKPSLRALYARYIEDTLLEIEGNAKTVADKADFLYKAYFSEVDKNGKRK